MTLEQWQWRDPALVLERKQESAAKRKAKCGQCKHYQTLVIKFEVIHNCAMGRRTWQSCTYFQQQGKK